ncbi:MAG TPA: penicillin-binding transpeptidase domain-containing protein [Acidimicrobiales bacterium]|jgi:peptidoglycan glycosyltransferase|nr:penicillin-binding transpeptidase domain-containing protein [Acidimicrobiales bacterium]
MEKRIRRLGIFMVLCFVALFIQLNNIQVLKAHSLATDSRNPAVIQNARTQPRGEILAADGTLLAQSVLAPASAYYKYQRVYPTATAGLFANIVGWDSIDYGKLGVEASYNQYLVAHNRTPKTIRDLLTNSTVTDNVTLTIQPKLQAAMATALNNIPQTGVSSPVSAVALDPTTGAILAMYSTPTYDPNPLVSEDIPTETAAYQADIHAPGNPILAKAYADTNAPGSTFKVVTSSAVYDHQPALADVDYPQAGCIPLPQSNLPLCNYNKGAEVCGGTLQVSLPQSCNTAFAQMGMSLGAQSENTEAQAFGFNQVPPLDLPGAVKSNFPSVADLTNNAPAQAYSAFGQQNVTASALQMALVAAGIANGGVIETPHVMAQIRDSQGNLVTSYTTKPWLKATTTSTAQLVTSLMQGVVTSGTAAGVFPADENVAAKTGTAEVGTQAQYTSDWMIAFVPGSHVVVALVAPFQASNNTGAIISGPPTCAILQAAINSTEACPSG